MGNSKLVSYTKLSPNCNKPRNKKISKITIHHMAGNLSLDTCYNSITGRGGSCNYAIDTNGKVGMFVEEDNRSWCSDSPSNDHQAITIEVSNDKDGGNWHISDKALAKLIDLCTDICQRNDIKNLSYTGDTKGSITTHKMFTATACPGPYLEGKLTYIADEVNRRLVNTSTSASNLYKVRKTWADSKSQIGAYKELANAKTACKVGYSVFDSNGKCVYTKADNAKILDKTGYKTGDKSDGIFAYKCLLKIAKSKKIITQEVDLNGSFGSGTVKATNQLLKKFGYEQNGIVGPNLIKKLYGLVK